MKPRGPIMEIDVPTDSPLTPSPFLPKKAISKRTTPKKVKYTSAQKNSL